MKEIAKSNLFHRTARAVRCAFTTAQSRVALSLLRPPRPSPALGGFCERSEYVPLAQGEQI
jgi:hypothetical protein